jgi:hypothetical protein
MFRWLGCVFLVFVATEGMACDNKEYHAASSAFQGVVEDIAQTRANAKAGKAIADAMLCLKLALNDVVEEAEKTRGARGAGFFHDNEAEIVARAEQAITTRCYDRYLSGSGIEPGHIAALRNPYAGLVRSSTRCLVQELGKQGY